MQWRRRAPGGQHNRSPGDEGFSLIEIGVATGVLFSVVLLIAYSGVLALIDVGHSRQKQGATGLANQALEQIRALPFATVSLGLVTSDIEPMTDPNITRTGGPGGYNYTYRGETIAHGSHTSLEPLWPHRRPATVEQTSYAVAVYVTRYKNNVNNNTLRVTAEVTWADALRKGIAPKVEAQTVLYPGSGCQSSATHPYAAPCVGFFDAAATSSPGVIAVSGWVVEPNGASTVQVPVSAEIVLPGQRSTLKQEQIVTVKNTADAAGVALTQDGVEQRYQGQSTTSAADTDPTSGTEVYEHPMPVGPIGPHSFQSTTQNRLVVSNLSGDALEATSAASADPGPTPCRRDAPVTALSEDDQQPCGMALAEQVAGGSITLTVNHAVTTPHVVPLVSVATSGITPAVTQFGFVDRSLPGTTDCVGTTEGCATARANSHVATMDIGPPSSALAQVVDGYTTAIAITGPGAATPTAGKTGAFDYSTGGVSASPGLTAPGVFAADRTLALGELTITMAGSFTVAADRLETDACASPCTRTNAVASTSLLTGTGTIDVWAGAVQVAHFEFSVNLGSLTAASIYKAAPSSA